MITDVITTKFCVNCKHYRSDDKCSAFSDSILNLVSGKYIETTLADCASSRANVNSCGKEAKYFKSKK